jgi:hypothetical protein
MQSQFTVGWRASLACCTCGEGGGIDVVYDELIVSEHRVLLDAELVVAEAGGGVALGVGGVSRFARRAAVVALRVHRREGGFLALGFVTLRMCPFRLSFGPGISGLYFHLGAFLRNTGSAGKSLGYGSSSWKCRLMESKGEIWINGVKLFAGNSKLGGKQRGKPQRG